MSPNLLFIAPRAPAVTGGGAAMRLGMMIQAMAEQFRVHLLIVPFYGVSNEPDAFVRQCCAAVAVAARPEGGELPNVSRFFENVRFAVVHVSRIVTAPFANEYLLDRSPERPRCTIDLDDIDSLTRLRFARLAEETGDAESARRETETAAQFSELEHHYLPLFERIYVCSEIDRQRVARQYNCGSQVTVVPNAVRIPPQVEALPPGSAFTFLFVGTMAYLPNQDAVTFFCATILPKIRERANRPVQLVVAGARPREDLLACCASHHGVHVTGTVPDLAPYYREADAVIVPIRAGGGTRLKILEACSYGKPVISTNAGAEGLHVTHGTELLLADTPEDFAEACLLAMNDSRVAAAIGEAGSQWVRANHGIENVTRALTHAPPFTGWSAGHR